MNSRKKQDASGKSRETATTLARRISSILPSSITKWFSSPSSSFASDPANIAEPEPKRRRLDEDSNRYLPTTTCASTNTQDSVYSAQAASFPTSRLSQKRKREDNLLNSTETKSRLVLPEAEKRVSFILSSSLASDDTVKSEESFLNHNRTSDMASNTLPVKDWTFQHGRPSFDINGTSGSTFYPGRTTYGGASNNWSGNSQNKIEKVYTSGNSLNKSVQITNYDMTGPSKRILNLLENYSSPLGEVRRISQFVTDEKRMNSSPASPNDRRKKISNKTQELHVPSITSLLSIKRKSLLMATTSTARQLLASHSSTAKWSPYPSNRSPSACKDSVDLKMKSTKKRMSSSALPSDLSTDVLKISKEYLPNFSFTMSKSDVTESSSTSVRDIETLQAENTLFKFTKPAETVVTQNHIFGNDCIDSLGSKQTVKETSITNDAPHTEIPTKYSSCESEKSTTVPEIPKTTNSLMWTCEDCWVKNNMSSSKCVCCGGKMPLNKMDSNKTKPAEINHVSLLKNTKTEEKCIADSSVKLDPLISTKKLNEEVKSPEEKWECHVCLLKNEKHSGKCVCCGAEKAGAEKSATLSSKQVEVTKSQEEKWECIVCLVRNEKDSSKCVCCEAEKPGTKKAAILSSKQAEVTKTQNEIWECTVCLVRNEKNTSKCVCCEADKPGAKKSELKFNFGLPSNTSFKFGIDPKTTEQAPEKQIEIEVKEKNNNVTTKGFSFGIPANNPDDKSLGNNLEKPKESTSTFSFGIPKENEKTTTFEVVKPEVSGILKDGETKDKPQQVLSFENKEINKPSVSFLPKLSKPILPISDNSKTEAEPSAKEPSMKAPTFTFKPPQKQNVSKIMEPAATPATFASTIALNPIQTPMFENIDMSSNQPPNKSLCFNLAPPTKSTNSLFGNKELSNTPNTFFQQSEASTTKTTPSAQTNTISSSFDSTVFSIPPLAPSTPMFNFGSISNQNTNNIGTSQSLNFSFGSNKIGSNKVVGFGGISKLKSPKTDICDRPTNNISSVVGSTSGSNLLSGNGITNNTFETTSKSSNLMSTGNSLFTSGSALPTGGLFGAPAQKENSGWPPSANLFSTPQSNLSSLPNRETSTFTFGNNMAFDANANNNVPTFGNNAQVPTVFGMPSANTNNGPSLFSSSINNAGAAGGLFGQQSASTMGSFTGPSPSFPEPSNQTPAFNFSAGQSPGVFNFSQQAGVRPNSTPPQFQVGSSSSPGQTRRIRKAVRRTTQR